jgi:GNAT superfamily N-acetyltransferase
VVEIREASPTEMPVAATLFREYIESLAGIAAASFAHQRVNEELDTLPGKYGAPGGVILLAWDDETCVGCVAVRPLAGACCELKRMYVRPTHRGRGIGRRLCEHAFDRARDRGYDQMKLDSDPRLAPALGLYRQLGFADTARYNADPDPGTVYLARAL